MADILLIWLQTAIIHSSLGTDDCFFTVNVCCCYIISRLTDDEYFIKSIQLPFHNMFSIYDNTILINWKHFHKIVIQIAI